MKQFFSIVMAILFMLPMKSFAVPIAPGMIIGFDVNSPGHADASGSRPAGIFLSANAIWNSTDSNTAPGSVVDSMGISVDGISTARFGSTWSNWGQINIAGETNNITEDYLFDVNGVQVDGHDAAFDIFGLESTFNYDIVLHSARLENLDKINGADVTIGATSINIPALSLGGSLIWPDAGFQDGITSALFNNVSADPSGNVRVYFDKINGEPIILTGLEIRVQSVPEPTTLALMGLGLVGIGYRVKRGRSPLCIESEEV